MRSVPEEQVVLITRAEVRSGPWTRITVTTDPDEDGTSAVFIRGHHPKIEGVHIIRPVLDGETGWLWEIVSSP